MAETSILERLLNKTVKVYFPRYNHNSNTAPITGTVTGYDDTFIVLDRAIVIPLVQIRCIEM